MRVIGGTDYYDSARAFGEDRELVFARGKLTTSNPVEIQKLTYMHYMPVRLLNEDESYGRGSEVLIGKYHCTYKPVTLWFAGKRYRGVKIFGSGFQEPRYIWNPEHFIGFAKEHKLRIISAKWSVEDKEAIKLVNQHFTFREANRSELDILIENRIGIAISVDQCKESEYKWHINTDGLREMKFASVVDPYQAYQELSMFVGGVIPRQANPIVEIKDEKVMLAKHGMDKWTFRKHKDD